MEVFDSVFNTVSTFTSPFIIIFILAIIILTMLIPRKIRRWSINVLTCCFKSCPIRLSCRRADYDIETMIDRFQEDLPDPYYFIKRLDQNPYLVKILDVLNRNARHFQFSILPCGSLREGYGKEPPTTSVLSADYDMMLYPWRCLAKIPDNLRYDRGELPESGGNVVFEVAKSNTTRPGFCLIKYRQAMHEVAESQKHWFKYGVLHALDETNDVTVLSNANVKLKIKEALEKSKGELLDIDKLDLESDYHVDITSHGPAVNVKIVKVNKDICPHKIVEYCTYCCICCFCGCCCLLCCGKSCHDCCNGEKIEHCVFEGDFVLSICTKEWPQEARGWFDRARAWPSFETVEIIRRSAVHIIPKASTSLCAIRYVTRQPLAHNERPDGFEQDVEFRYSFSEAEQILAANVPPQARDVYIAFKSTMKRLVKEVGCSNMQTFAYKSIFYKTLEEQVQGYWETNNPNIRSEFLLTLFQRFYRELRATYCQHYWIEEQNLFEDLLTTDSDPPEIQLQKRRVYDELLSHVERLVENPGLYIMDDWTETNRCIQKHCCFCDLSNSNCGKRKIEIPCRYPEEHCCGCPHHDYERKEVFQLY